MELFYRADHVSNVLNNVCGADLAEGAVAEGKWKMIKVCDDVRPGMRITIQAQSAGVLVQPAAYIENWKLAYRKGRADVCLCFRG